MWRPDPSALRDLQKRVEKVEGGSSVQDNHLYSGLFDRQSGIFADAPGPAEWVLEEGHTWKRIKKRLRRREWIEAYFPIRNKSGELELLKLNPAQRMFEHKVLQMERAGVPVRIITCKSRQMGFSTYVQAIMFERVLRGHHVRGLIVADNKERSETLLAIAQIARQNMLKDTKSNTHWDFKMTSKARDTFRFGEPISGEVEVTTAEAPRPGQGGTRTLLHLSESAHFKNPERTYASCISSLPTLPWTYGFEESTANGDRGRFRNDFWDSWREKDVPLYERKYPWSAMFFAWWQHPEYAWTRTYGAGRHLPEKTYSTIMATLSAEEGWLLKQKFLRRWTPNDVWERVKCHYVYELVMEGTGNGAKIVGQKRVHKDNWVWRRKGVGWNTVSVDQLAWRRETILDKHFAGNLDLFNQEYPSRPQVAFMSSGRPVFNQEAIDGMLAATKGAQPVIRGTLRRVD